MLVDLDVFLDLFVFIFCVWMFCLHVCLCTMCVSYVHRIQKNTSDLPELGLQMSLIHYAEAGN